MAFTDALTVTVGNPTKKSEYDNIADNTEWLQGKADVDHDFDITTGTGYHNKEIHLVNADETAACTISIDGSGILRFASTGSSTTPPAASTTVRFNVTTDSAGPSF